MESENGNNGDETMETENGGNVPDKKSTKMKKVRGPNGSIVQKFFKKGVNARTKEEKSCDGCESE